MYAPQKKKPDYDGAASCVGPVIQATALRLASGCRQYVQSAKVYTTTAGSLSTPCYYMGILIVSEWLPILSRSNARFRPVARTRIGVVEIPDFAAKLADPGT